MSGVLMAAEEIHLACRRHQLRLTEVRHSRPGASVFVARVRDPLGADLLLKQTASGTGQSEIAAMRAWSGTGVTPRFVAELEPGLYLADWVDGPVLANVAPEEAVPAAQIGRALRVLHTSPVSDALLDTRHEVRPARTNQWVHLPAPMRAHGVQLAAALTAGHPPDDVALHGDLAPTNVILAVGGPRLIDPVGRRGLAAWDLAQIAVSAEGRGRHLLAEVLAGYGAPPPLLPEMLAWMVLFYLDKNLASPNSPFTPRLQRLADSLLTLGDPDAFATACLL